jgi:hypothetical protein
MMSTIELYAALSKAQAEIKGAVKDSTNPHFKSRYADLESVIDAVKQPFFKFGLSFVQGVEGDSLVTTICHASGGTITSRVPLIIGKNDMQGVGSAITYARRYGLAAAAGVSQTDDDGNAACEPPRAPVAAPKPAPKPVVAMAKKEAPKPAQEPVEPIPPGLLYDGVIPPEAEENYRKQLEAWNAHKAERYSDDKDSKLWLMREMAFYGISKTLANFEEIAGILHKLSLGKTREEAKTTIMQWCSSQGFKKG